MQRCFRLNGEALSHLLESTSTINSRLEAATLSHLFLQNWPSLPAPGGRPLARYNFHSEMEILG